MSRRLSIAAVAAMLAMAGCNPPDADSSAPVELQIYTWWTEDGEEQALDTLEEENQQRHPNVRLITNSAQNAEEAFEGLNTRLYYKDPPDTFQANGGSKLLSRVVFGSNYQEITSQLVPLPREHVDKIEYGARDFLRPLLEFKKQLYGVPLNIHRINNLYFSIPKLKELRKIPLDQAVSIADLMLPKDVLGFVGLVEQLCVPNENPSLSLGWNDSFTVETLVFENLMPSVAMSAAALGLSPDDDFDGKMFFEEFWKGYRPPTEPITHRIIDKTLRLAQELWPCVKRDVVNEDGKWSAPFNDLLAPKTQSSVTFAVMGDWATGYLEYKGYVFGKDFGFVPFPGTESLFIYTTDTLPLTVGANYPKETLEFLDTALTPEAQLKFSQPKGSIPALTNLDAEQKQQLLSPHQREIIDLLDNTTDEQLPRSPAISGLLTPTIDETYFRDVLKEMLAATDPVNGRDIMHHALENNYWLLALWTETIAP